MRVLTTTGRSSPRAWFGKYPRSTPRELEPREGERRAPRARASEQRQRGGSVNAPQPPHDESGHDGQHQRRPPQADSAPPESSAVLPSFDPVSSPAGGIPTTENPEQTQVISSVLRSGAAQP